MLNVDPEMVINTLREDLKTRSRVITYADIDKETGLTVDWIRKFCLNKVRNPPFDRVCKLYAYIYKTSTINL